MKLKPWALALTILLAAQLGAADHLPPELGFKGSFSRGAGDRFQFSFASGAQLSLGRNGKITSLHGAASSEIKDKSGRVLALKNGAQALITLSYDSQGRVARIITGEGENFGVSYTRNGRIHSILFPSRKRGVFSEEP